MAQIHPSFPLHAPASLGGYRERDILKMLEKGLDDRFDVFHNVPWSGMQGDQQSFGEYDFVIVSPGGQLLILEIKSGDVIESDVGLTKQYGRQGPKDIGHQMRRMHSSLLQRIDNGDLPQVHVGAMLVLPDYYSQGASVGYPPDRMVDASQIDQLCQCISASFPVHALPEDQRQRVLDFLANRFEVRPDVATHIGQVQQATTQLASGLATWVPRIRATLSSFIKSKLLLARAKHSLPLPCFHKQPLKAARPAMCVLTAPWPITSPA